MGKYITGKKIVILTISILATTLILTGTFAWSVRLFSTTGGLGEDYYYIVKLLDEDSDPLFVINNWKSGTLDKKVYATSSYTVVDIAKQYDDIIDDNEDSIFKDTWVRIKLEESFMRNGETIKTTITEMLGDTLKSSVSNGKYFVFDTINNTEIKTLSDWNKEQGRFWILDEDTGWLYWAQPLLATTFVDGSNPELLDQTTDHIIDTVELIHEPTGVWEYTIKATLEAMDVDLQGYNEEGAWSDVDSNHGIYPLFVKPLAIDTINFPDTTFRTWVIDNVTGAADGFLTSGEIKLIKNLNMSNQGFENIDLTGIEYFTNLESFDISGNKLKYLDVSNINKTAETVFKYNPQYHSNGITPLQQTNDSDQIKEWSLNTDSYDEATGYLLINTYNFSNAKFIDYLLHDTTTDGDNYDPTKAIVNGMLNPVELAKVTMINVNDKGMSSISGLEHFPNLLQLRIRNNNLVAIDLSGNKALTNLYIHDNSFLTTLDLRNNTALKIVYALDNKSLTSLLLGSHKDMTLLHVYGNQLKTLDISGIPNTLKIDTTNFRYSPQYRADKVTQATLQGGAPTVNTTTMTWN